MSLNKYIISIIAHMSLKLTLNYVIDTCNMLHNFKYDYSKVVYKGLKGKVEIICPVHGSFFQDMNHHIYRKQGCSLCGNVILRQKMKETQSSIVDVISKCKEKHHNFYQYKHIENYDTVRDRIEIQCPLHGWFKQTLWHHMSGHGCKKCNYSHGEQKIEAYLIDHKINFIPQHTFKDCISHKKRKLTFDFYLTDYNLIIEFNGKQHYEHDDYFGGLDKFNRLQLNDNSKKTYCKNNNINLLVIKYNQEKNIKHILDKILCVPW